MNPTTFMGEYLEAVRSAVAPAVRASLPSGGPRSSLYDPLTEFLGRAGKALRPAICVAACRAFGGTTEQVMPSAVSLELLHNAFLVHDDVEDGSLSRRGAPTIHEAHGVPIAINAGDGLAALALQPLAKNVELLGTSMHNKVMAEYAHLLRSSIEGQAIELGWRRDKVAELSSDDYLEMVILKTCAYTTTYPLRVGAMIGSWGRADLDPVTAFGVHLGAAFQITDDILNLTSDESVYGKEINGDLVEGKRTLMLIHLLKTATGEDRLLAHAFMTRDEGGRPLEMVEAVRELLDVYGSIDYARHYAEGLVEGARRSFAASFGELADTPDKRFLEELIDFVVGRTF